MYLSQHFLVAVDIYLWNVTEVSPSPSPLPPPVPISSDFARYRGNNCHLPIRWNEQAIHMVIRGTLLQDLHTQNIVWHCQDFPLVTGDSYKHAGAIFPSCSLPTGRSHKKNIFFCYPKIKISFFHSWHQWWDFFTIRIIRRFTTKKLVIWGKSSDEMAAEMAAQFPTECSNFFTRLCVGSLVGEVVKRAAHPRPAYSVDTSPPTQSQYYSKLGWSPITCAVSLLLRTLMLRECLGPSVTQN